MTPSSLLIGLIVALNAAPAFADDSAAPPAVASIDCGKPVEGKEIRDWPDSCLNADPAKINYRKTDVCPGAFWNYMYLWAKQSVGSDGNLDEAKFDEVMKGHWSQAGADTHKKYFDGAVKTFEDDRAAYNKLRTTWGAANQACQAFSSGGASKLADFRKAADDFNDTYSAYEMGIGEIAPADSTEHRLTYAFGEHGAEAKTRFSDEPQALAKTWAAWRNVFQAQQQAADQSQKAGDQNAAHVQSTIASIDNSQFHARLAKGDAAAASDELRAAFDQSGLKHVRVGDATKGADGTLLMDIDVSKEDWAKMNEQEKAATLARLKALGIPNPQVGQDVHQEYRIPTDQQAARIDAMEKVILDHSGTVAIRAQTTGNAMVDASAKEWVQKALGGSSVSAMAADPHSQQELQDKFGAVKNKAAADYAAADADAVKTCQENHDKLKQMGIDPSAADAKCAADRQKALQDYHHRLDALGAQERQADQSRAGFIETNLKAYDEFLDQKLKDHAALKAKAASALTWQGVGKAMSQWQPQANAAIQKLDQAIAAEKRSMAAALAKVPAVKDGRQSADSISAGDPLVGQVMNADSAQDVYDSRHRADEDKLQEIFAKPRPVYSNDDRMP